MHNKVRILIVEDEFMISEDIAMRLSDFGFDVVGIASSAVEAIEILNKGETDLALLDINIDGEMDGIELAKIVEKQYNIPFIFLTSLASKNIVERAKETSPSAYLLKPFNDRQVQITIDMALVNFSKKVSVFEVEQPQKEKSNETTVILMEGCLFLKKESHFERVNFEDIFYLSAESNYTTVFTNNGRYIYSFVLKNFEGRLPHDIFIRVHRSFIVNVNHIKGFEGSYLHIGDKQIPVSRKYREDIFNAFDVIK